MMASDQPPQDGSFSSGSESGRFAGASDVLDDFGPLNQQVVHRVVDSIQFGSQCGQTTRAPGIPRRGFLRAGRRRGINR